MQSLSRRVLIFAAVFAIAALAAPPADTPPDLSGEWKLNVEKSNFGPMPPPSSSTRKMTHKDPSLHVASSQKSDQGDMDTEMDFDLAGKETTNTIKTPNGDFEIKTTAKWEGKVLVMNSKFNIQGMDIGSTERWVVSEDGKTLTIEQKLTTPQGDFEMTQVYEKAAA